MRKYISILVLLCGFFGGSLGNAQTTIVSVEDEGDWSDPSTWIGGIVPGEDDDVVISDDAMIYLDVSEVVVKSLKIGSASSNKEVTLEVLAGNKLTIKENCDIYSGAYRGTSTVRAKQIVVLSNAILEINGLLSIHASANDLGGIRLLNSANLYLKGDIILPNNKGYLIANSTATVTFNGPFHQQIYMGYDTEIKYPNLVVDGFSVTVITTSDTATGVGQITGDLVVRSGVFDNGAKKIDVGKDILIEEEATFRLSGGSTILVNNTNLTLDGKLVTEHADGLGGFKPLGSIGLGSNAEIEYAGNLNGQTAGFHWFPTTTSYPKLTFNNVNGTSLDRSVSVENLTIESGAVFNGTNNNGIVLTVTESWTNNGVFNGQTGTVRFGNNITKLQGGGANNFNNLILYNGVDFTAPTICDVSGDLKLESGTRFAGENTVTVGDSIVVANDAYFSAPQILNVSRAFLVDNGGHFIHNNGRVVFQGPLSRTSGVGTFYDVTATGTVFQGRDTIIHELRLLGPTTSFVENSASLVLDLDKGYVDPASTSSITGITFIKDVQRSGNSYLSFPLPTAVVELKNMGFKSVHNYSESRTSAYASMGNSESIPVEGKGYALVLNNSSATIELTGNYNAEASDVSVNLTSTYKNGELVSGRTSWNLIGNPYPFELDWDELRRDFPFVYESIYISSGEKFLPYVGDVPANGGTIPAMQAFMVYLRRLGYDRQESFVLRKTAGLRDAPRSLYRKAPVFNVLKLEVANGSLTDATYVRLTDEATTDFDSDKDAMKLKNSGTTPSFYSYLLGNNYAINSVPATFSKFSLPLAFEAKIAGSYTITLSEEYVYDLPYEIYLEDKVLNILHPIGLERNYTFFSNLNEAVGRFILRFENPVVTAMKEASSNFVKVFSTGNDITVQGLEVEQGAEVALYDIAGRLIAHYSDVDLVNKSFTFTSLDRAGMYIVNVVSGERSHSERVVLY